MRKPKAGSKWFSRPSTVCRLCGHAAGDSVQEVEEHTAACLGSGGNTELQLFSVEDERQVFRLVFAAKPTATFEDLDQALRRHWMECCGHLSEFTVLREPQPNVIPHAPMHEIFIGGPPNAIVTISSRYARPEESGEDDWRDSGRERLSQRLGQERLVASYAYDFGSTTVVLVIAGPKVSVRPAAASRLFAGGARLALVARNERPQVPCCECGKPALYILNEGSNFEDKEYGHFWCSRACAHRSHYDPYLVSHFWNSPRSGVCGYDGPEQPEEGEDLWGDDSSSSEEDEEEEEESSEDEEEEEEQQQQQPQRRGGGAGRGAAAGGTAKKAAAAAKPAVGKKAAAAAKPAAGKKAAAAKPAASKKATAAKTKAGGKAAPKPAAKQAASPAAKGRAAAGRGKGRAASGGGKGRAAAGPAAKKPAAGAKGKAAAGTKRQAAAAAPTSRSKRAK